MNNTRTGTFTTSMQMYGIVTHLGLYPYATYKEIFGQYLFGTNSEGMVLVRLHSHNAVHVLQDRLSQLCEALKLETVSVVDMSDWTVRDFVLEAKQ